jgi:polyphenol oxidase
VFRKTPENAYGVEPWLGLEWLVHGFGTRDAGGVWLEPERFTMLNQVHSATVVEADGRRGRIGDGDALISAIPGVLVGIRTADCVPVLVVDERHKVVAAVHAGWRGTVAGVLSNTLEALAERFRSRPEDLHVAIGPAIGACCYEVGPEVAGALAPWFPERTDLNGQTTVDLAETLRRQARSCGIGENHIYCARLCTRCHPEEFYSYRREGEAAGRMVSLAGIRA